jgi:hypothetical protein
LVGWLTSWDDIKLLTVVVDRLERWWAPGLLCIGDAAHAMSPVGGVGINLAIQDAIAAANRLAPALRAHRLTTDDLAWVQARRAPPAHRIQALQVAIQDRVIARALSGRIGLPCGSHGSRCAIYRCCGAPSPGRWRSGSGSPSRRARSGRRPARTDRTRPLDRRRAPLDFQVRP